MNAHLPWLGAIKVPDMGARASRLHNNDKHAQPRVSIWKRALPAFLEMCRRDARAPMAGTFMSRAPVKYPG